ncbi:16S rRNA (guanine(966)-N(2))-methyltransferase RsmD [Cognatilysobacter segetis]|uniref:16S rRNA (guanine(966)-N(2))-methyltransferase RsmD n=1 Tax=Cognatilysobacter segetis TaxID=2492394 RepID=UPI00105B8349|nr:16S rRNA (guanine(966)-N(2))-methyltransferase RsmD [Lysobacter segetis]
MNKPAGKIRLIGGHWRGTRLDVPASPGLRPTGDRVRETLFNWLMPYLPGARVIDVFAGTGALGLEALSRGAADAVLIERDAALASSLRGTLGRLDGGARGRVVQGDALAWLAGTAETFDIAFVDPPFAGGLWTRVWPALAPRLAPDALVHVESPTDVDPGVPDHWALHREGRTREVRHALYRVPAAGPAAAATLDPDPAAGEPSSRCENP